MNPFQAMMQKMNPQAMIQNLLRQNPALRQVMPLIEGKNPKQLETTFRNLCKQRGIDPEQFMRRQGMNPPNGGSNTNQNGGEKHG